MALINQNSIIGVTSITSPSSSNVLTIHVNDTTERLRVSETGLSFSGTNSSLDTSGNATFNGNVSIGGTLTYEDVTNIDSVGVVTARNGLHVTSGSVGIGTDNPSTKLEVIGDITITNGTQENAIRTNSAGQLQFMRNSASNNTVSITINDEDGQVGIATDNPSQLLDVGGNTTIASNGRVNIYRPTPTATNTAFQINSDVGTDDSIQFIIQSGGSVGIGTDNPLNGLDVNQSEGRLRVNRFSHLLMQNKNDSTTDYWGISARNGGELDIGYGTPDGNSIIDGDKLTITSSGSVGINTTDPQSRLEVFTDNDTDFGDSANTNNTNSLIRLFNKNGTDNTAVNNYVGIRFDVANGATSSAWLSYVRTGNNTGAFQFKARNAASSYPEVARILSSGGITFGGDTAQANALNDYEEGTLGWRLQRSNAIGSGSNNSDTLITYTKVGNRVYVSGYLYTANTGNSTGIVVELRDDSNVNNYATLPYVPNHSGGFPITGTRTIEDSYRNMAVTFRDGQSQVYIYNDDGNNAYLKNSNNVNIGSSQTHMVIQFCGSYTTNS